MKSMDSILGQLSMALLLIIGCSGYTVLSNYRNGLIIILFVVTVIKILLHRKIRIPNYVIGVIAFVLICMLSIINGFAPAIGIKYMLYYITVMLMLISGTFKNDQIVYFFEVLRVIIWIEAISVFLSFINYNFFVNCFWWILDTSKTEALNRVLSEVAIHSFSGLAGEKAEAAFLLSIGCAIEFSKLYSSEMKSRNYFYVIFMVIALFLTGKRTLLAATIFGFIYLAFILGQYGKGLRRLLVLLMAGCGVFIVVIGMTDIVTNYMSRFTSFFAIDDSGRTQLWEFAIKMFKQRPLLGFGYGSYNTCLDRAGFTYYGSSWEWHAHNGWLQLLAETGIIGTMAFATMTGRLYYKGYKKLKQAVEIKEENNVITIEIVLLFSITTMLIYSLTGNVFVYHNQLLMFLTFIFMSQELGKTRVTNIVSRRRLVFKRSCI